MKFVDIDATHENAEAICPGCQQSNTFNRRSDLKTERAIGRAEVTCEHCGTLFAIGADLIDPPHVMLLLGAGDAFERKQYGDTVMGVARAYEAFFGHFARVRLVLRPQADDIDDLNHLRRELDAKIKKFAFESMRHLLLRIVLDGTAPKAVADARKYVGQIPEKGFKAPPKAEIEAVAEEKLRDLLLGLSTTTVHVLRNRVAHKDAYRPSREEAENSYAEGRRIIFPLASLLHVDANEEFYLNGGAE